MQMWKSGLLPSPRGEGLGVGSACGGGAALLAPSHLGTCKKGGRPAREQ